MVNIDNLSVHSFDIIGDIAILQIPKGMEKKSKKMALEIIKKNKNVKTVYARGKFRGRLRKHDVKFIYGINKAETIYKESSCLMKLNVKTCYFSPRLSHDRLDIAKQVKNHENILVMFSGIAPYGLVLGKKSKAKKIYCVELSKEATKYALDNVKLNKIKNIEVIQGDVKRICPKFKQKNVLFDRIIMARPQLKDSFLKEAFIVAKKNSIIHFYDFLFTDEIEEGYKKIENEAKKSKKKYKILGIKKIRDIGPRKYHLRFDIKMLN